jgi:hypothetical protein
MHEREEISTVTIGMGQRLRFLVERLQTGYESLGHSPMPPLSNRYHFLFHQSPLLPFYHGERI